MVPLWPEPVFAGRISLILPIRDSVSTINTGRRPLAFESDSVYCNDRLLQRGHDYTINPISGQLSLINQPLCDTLRFTAFLLPSWLNDPSGNPVPQGKRLLEVSDVTDYRSPVTGQSVRKLSLSGNKSFSFQVGRSGEGRFSQGLNLDFDARMADGLRLRGAVSDRGTTGNQTVSGDGGTVLLSELDKYFFEIEGKRIMARGGDITAAESPYLPAKRIKGIYAAYQSEAFDLAADLGRPAGKFVSRQLNGIDGRQGPYQAVGSDGLPTGIVPGTEKIYVDGRPLESGADKHYLIDYASGRITFSPRILITSRSRIEIDFEAAANDYEQVVYDVAGDIRTWNGKAKLSMGGRRETDDKDRLRFAALSSSDIKALEQAGDTVGLAFTTGVVADTAGDYQLVIDSAGTQYYRYAGSGAGDYRISFSYVGEGQGDYQYLGDGVYQYRGQGAGGYLPIRYLSLPVRNDFFFSTLELLPYEGGVWRLEYQGNNRDNNLFSPFDDGDNFKSRLVGDIRHKSKNLDSDFNVRFRQQGFDPVYRVDPPDDSRYWALPIIRPSGDEFRLYLRNVWRTSNNRLSAEAGYLDYSDNLRSRRLQMAGNLFDDKSLSPRFNYGTASSEKVGDAPGGGLYERYGAGVAVKPLRQARLELDYDQELVKNAYSPVPDLEKYHQGRASIFWGRTILSASRRVEYRSDTLGVKGPRQDKIELTSDETLGRLQVSLTGTWFNQKSIDSDRGDRTERLFITAFRYAPASAWMTLQAEYRQNRQDVRATGYRYILVNSGEGDYRLEEGRYLYDPDGDYIRIREELGEAASVSTGEKNHNITVYPGRIPSLENYKELLSQIAFRMRTEIIEEMSGGDRRVLSWVLPWASRSGIEYLRRFRRESYTCLLFPAFNFYILNLSYANSFEEQESGSLIYRSDREYTAEIKNRISPIVLSRLEWRHNRNDESGTGVIDLNLTADRYTAGLNINPPRLQLAPAVSYLRFTDKKSGGEGHGIIFSTEAIWRQPEKGEIRFNGEVRSLTEKTAFSQPEYLVTDGMRFGQSALVNLVANYEISKLWRLTINLTDRFYEGRPAEFVGRGELVARF